MLVAIGDFAPKGATVEIVNDLDLAIAEISQHQPLNANLTKRLQEDLLYDRIYSSAVTEGNRLSRRETIAVLSSGIVEAGSRKDVKEIENLGRAILAVDEMLRAHAPLSEGVVREMNKIVLQGLSDDAGKYRSNGVAIAGSKTQLPAAGDVPDLVRKIVTDLNEQAKDHHPLVVAAWTHWAITRVHPFRDGNGRVARLFQDYLLLSRHYLAAPLFAEDRERQYYEALETADSGDPQPFIQLLAKNVLRIADRYLSAIREDADKNKWLQGITRVAREKVRETEHRRFIRWDRRIGSLRSEFQELADELSQNVTGLTCRVRTFGGVDFEKYKMLRARGRAERTWMFAVDIWYDQASLRFVFWGAQHFKRSSDPMADLSDEPAVLVSMEEHHGPAEPEHRPYYRQLDELDEARITLREVVLHGEELLRRRYNPAARQDEWDFGVSAGRIAMDFLTEALQTLGLA
jgi:Fic family protein